MKNSESNSEISESDNNIRVFSLKDFFKSNKYPLIVTLGFFLIMSYVTFFHHHYWWENDGIFYFDVGKQILNGDGWNVKILDAPLGGPVLFATLDSVFHDGFVTVKIISLLSGTGIVLVSYYILRNIFNSKIALLGQLFFAFNPRFNFLTTLSLNELPSVLLISVSLFFITKKNLKLFDTIIVGLLLGISFMIRYQAAPVLIAILIFLLIRNRKIRINLSYVAVTCDFF